MAGVVVSAFLLAACEPVPELPIETPVAEPIVAEPPTEATASESRAAPVMLADVPNRSGELRNGMSHAEVVAILGPPMSNAEIRGLISMGHCLPPDVPPDASIDPEEWNFWGDQVHRYVVDGVPGYIRVIYQDWDSRTYEGATVSQWILGLQEPTAPCIVT